MPVPTFSSKSNERIFYYHNALFLYFKVPGVNVKAERYVNTLERLRVINIKFFDLIRFILSPYGT